MELYRMGPDAGPQRVGLCRGDALSLYERQKALLPPGSTVHAWLIDTGRAGLSLAIFRGRMKATRQGENWFDLTADQADAVLEDCVASTSEVDINLKIPASDPTLIARMIFYLRTEVFQTTQEMFGEIAGRSSAVVSRWESGDVAPGLDEMLRLRAVALALGLAWSDAHVLDPAGVPLPNEED